jgi:hypothetical protein
MTEEKGIQITRGSKEVIKFSSQDGIEISHSEKPISGAVSESLELQVRCASTRKGFKLLLERKRTGQTSRYRVMSILKEESGRKTKAVSSSSARTIDIDINQIDGILAVQCPYCGGGKYSLIKCACGGLSCGGGVHREGNSQYQECPWCQSVGVIRGHIETLSGERSSPRQGLPSRGNSQQQLKTTADAALKLPSGQKPVTKQ